MAQGDVDLYAEVTSFSPTRRSCGPMPIRCAAFSIRRGLLAVVMWCVFFLIHLLVWLKQKNLGNYSFGHVLLLKLEFVSTFMTG